MGLAEAVLKSRELCADGKIRVYCFGKQGPVEEESPNAKLKYLFSPQILGAVLDSLSSQQLEETLSTHTSAMVDKDFQFKRACEVRATDLEPVLDRINSGTKLGIQAANPSLPRQLDLIRYKRIYETAKDKIEAHQQLSQDEAIIFRAFSTDCDSGISRLDFARYYCRTVNFMFNIGLLLANCAQEKGVEPLLALCLDDYLTEDYEKIASKHGLDRVKLIEMYHERLGTFRGLLKQGTQRNTGSYIFNEVGLEAELCYCDACNARICPSRASKAVETIAELGCDAVVNFYIEDDGPVRMGLHYERIERGMLHYTEVLKDNTLRVNVYFGRNRSFMVIHESGEKRE
ncbi:hypothetical protein HZC31_05045 [Candidatus Woesearchaeota archaeon]|nr:hypothetical protein [Candidatus Woesearchaeota archaeon]